MARYKEGKSVRYWYSKYLRIYFIETIEGAATSTTFAYEEMLDDILEQIKKDNGNIRITKLETSPLLD